MKTESHQVHSQSQVRRPQRGAGATRPEKANRAEPAQPKDRQSVRWEPQDDGDGSYHALLKGLQHNYSDRLHGNDALHNAAKYAQDPLQAAVMATEGQSRPDQLGDEATHLGNALQGLTEGRQDSQWARPYADNLARMAWFQQYGQANGLQPQDAPADYLSTWFDCLKGGDRGAPLVGATRDRLTDLGIGPTPAPTPTPTPTPTPKGQSVRPGVDGMLSQARSMLNQDGDSAAVRSLTGQSGLNSSASPWCAAFAMNLLRDHGVTDLDGLSNPNYVPTIKNWAQSRGQYGEAGQYTPKAGDAIMFDWEGDGTDDHIGLVERVENGRVYTIEGNSTAGQVRENSYALNSSSIDGYLKT